MNLDIKLNNQGMEETPATPETLDVLLIRIGVTHGMNSSESINIPKLTKIQLAATDSDLKFG